MNKVHTRINWENYPSDATPINEDNLNAMDVSIDEIDSRVVEMDASKATKTEVASVVSNVTFDEKTGIFTFTRKNGTSFTVNTLLEKIATNFTYDYSTQTIILTLVDGTTQTIDLSALITQYEFTDSSTIDFTVDSNGKVSAKIINGSITDAMLESGYLSKVTTQANTAKTNATKAQSYAVGGTNSRDGEDTDNAKHYYTKSKEMFDTLVGAGDIDTVTTTDSTLAGSKASSLKINAIRGNSEQNGTPTVDVPIAIESSGDSGSITIKSYGSNIFGGLKLAQALVDSGSTNVTIDENAKTVTYKQYNGTKQTLFDGFKENTQYTIILDGMISVSGGTSSVKSTNLRIKYTDGTYNNLLWGANVGTEETLVITTTKGKSVDSFLYYFGDSDTSVLNYEKCGIFEGVITADNFEPYTETTFTIPLSEPLRGIDDVKDEIVKQDGVWGIVRRWAEIVYDGTNVKINSKASTEMNNLFYSFVKGAIQVSSNGKVYPIACSHLQRNTSSNLYNSDLVGVSYWSNDYRICLAFGVDSELTTTTKVNEWFAEQYNADTPLTVIYMLATPTFEPFAEEYQSLFYQLESYENVTYITTDSTVQPTIEAEYAVTDAGVHMLNNYAKSNLAELKVDEANKESTTADIWKHDNITNNSISLVKVGRLVMFSVNFTLSKNGSGGMSLFRLPEGYRPVATVYGSLNVAEDVPKYVFEIFENGYIGVDGIPEAETYKMTATFICEK